MLLLSRSRSFLFFYLRSLLTIRQPYHIYYKYYLGILQCRIKYQTHFIPFVLSVQPDNDHVFVCVCVPAVDALAERTENDVLAGPVGTKTTKDLMRKD